MAGTSLDSSPSRRQSPLDRKSQSIIDAARRIFLESGFDAASMDDVALSAGVSKRTIYNRYGSKQELFDFVILDACREVSWIELRADYKTPPVEFLENIGFEILKVRSRPQYLSLFRLIAANSEKMPQLGDTFFEEAVEPLREFMVDYFEQLIAMGRMESCAADEAYLDYLSLIVFPYLIGVVYARNPSDNLDEFFRKLVRAGMRKFTKLHPIS